MNRNCPIVVAGVGFGVLFLGIVCSWYAFPKIVHYAINKRLALEEGNEVYEVWKKQPFPLKFKVYFWNVSNTYEVQQGIAKPKLKELGPYIYDETWERVNITIDEKADTIKYMLKRSFTFNAKDSGCRTEEDRITMVNGALVSTALQVYLILPSAMVTVNDAIPYLYQGANDIFIRATVKDILFDGILIECHDPEVEFICGAMRGMLPPTMEFTNNGKDFKFAMFAYMNNTLAGPFEIGRGMKNTTRGEILSYKGSKNVGVWAGASCNMINGSDSTLFYPHKKRPERFYVFSPDICRSMFVKYEKSLEYKGIPIWKYINVEESLNDNGPNDCFCPRIKDEDYEDIPNCPKKGMGDITFCVKGPILISNPHFYLGDPSLVEFAQGTHPEKELHENFMFFEPVTGNPIWGAKRMQMNVQLRRFDDFELLANVSEGVCPMLWIEEGVEIPEKFRDQLTSGLFQLKILDIVKWFFIVSGVGTMMGSFFLVMFRERLLCFGLFSSNKIAITEVKEQPKRGRDVDSIGEQNFNNTVLYPTLYPQMEDKNVNDRIIRRNNMNMINLPQTNSWQLKN